MKTQTFRPSWFLFAQKVWEFQQTKNQGTVRRPVSQPRFKAHHPVGRWSRMPSTKFSGAWLWYSWVVVGVACYYRFIVDSLLLVSEMVFSILFDHKVWIYFCCCCCCGGLLFENSSCCPGFWWQSFGDLSWDNHYINATNMKFNMESWKMINVPHRSGTSTMLSMFRFVLLESQGSLHYQPKLSARFRTGKSVKNYPCEKHVWPHCRSQHRLSRNKG